jgi:PST family polysaccharide transporter
MNFERSDKNVANRVFKGALFLTGARFILRLFSLVNLVVLGRLLVPDDYGVATLAIVTIGFVQVFSDIRVNSALIALKDVEKRYLDTGFTMNLIRGVLIAALLFFAAGPIAAYMDEPRLADVLRVICIVLVFDGLKNPAFMMYQRNIDFSREFKRRAAATVLGSAAAIGVAIATESYWAIVAGTLAGRFMESAFTYYRIPYKPVLRLREWRMFFGFGGWLTASGIVSYLLNMLPQIVIGKFIGPGPLGHYTVGRDVSMLATRELAAPLSQALFPGLSAISHNKNRLRGAFRKAQATILGVALPIGVGSALVANELIAVLVGDKWLPDAADVVVLLAPTIAISMISSATDGLAMAKLATRQMLMRNLVIAAFSVPAFVFGLWQWGFIGVIYATIFRFAVNTAVNMYFAKEMIGDSFLAPLAASWRSFVAAGLMSAAVIAVPAPFEKGQEELQVLIEMMPRVLLGGAVYVGAHYLLWRLAGKPDGFEAKMQEFLGKAGGAVAGRLRR